MKKYLDYYNLSIPMYSRSLAVGLWFLLHRCMALSAASWFAQLVQEWTPWAGLWRQLLWEPWISRSDLLLPLFSMGAWLPCHTYNLLIWECCSCLVFCLAIPQQPWTLSWRMISGPTCSAHVAAHCCPWKFNLLALAPTFTWILHCSCLVGQRGYALQ